MFKYEDDNIMELEQMKVTIKLTDEMKLSIIDNYIRDNFPNVNMVLDEYFLQLGEFTYKVLEGSEA
jgi:hypothetical protein